MLLACVPRRDFGRLRQRVATWIRVESCQRRVAARAHHGERGQHAEPRSQDRPTTSVGFREHGQGHHQPIDRLAVLHGRAHLLLGPGDLVAHVPPQEIVWQSMSQHALRCKLAMRQVLASGIPGSLLAIVIVVAHALLATIIATAFVFLCSSFFVVISLGYWPACT